MEYTGALWGGATQRDVVDETTSRRLDEMGTKVNKIMSRIKGAGKERRKDDVGKRLEEMLIKLGRLKGENRMLDEKMALKVE